MKNKEYQICTNCVMDTTDSKITFDENGVCDHCQTFYKDIKPNWHTDEKGFEKISKIVEDIKEKAGQCPALMLLIIRRCIKSAPVKEQFSYCKRTA